MKISSTAVLGAALWFFQPVPAFAQNATSEECQALAFTSCKECTAAVGCRWCPWNAICFPPGIVPQPPSNCAAEDLLSTCPQETTSPFSDPLYDAQAWVFEALNVLPVWEMGLTGKGILIQVTDSGVDANHAEFAGKFNVSASCDIYLPEHPEACNQTIEGDCPHGFDHGNSVASIAVANGDNDECAVGVAPGASVSSCENNLAGTIVSFENGLEDPECEELLPFYSKCVYHQNTEEEKAVLEKVIKEGRDGKGQIITFASGNEYGYGEWANMEEWLNSRYTICVGAVGKDLKHASYSSTGGAAQFISGPGGDVSGADASATNHITAAVGGGCMDSTVGTSFATPAVAGAIALLLEDTPNLGWRDVQGILASTAKKVDEDSPTWVTNAAGLHHNEKYGFGLMDTEAAVKAAKTWKNYGPEKVIMEDSGSINLDIPDNGWQSSTLVLEAEDFIVEHVVVELHADHVSRGDLLITLTSPSGTAAELLPSGRYERTLGVEDWELMSVKTWGEQPSGNWTLTLADEIPGDYATGSCTDLGYRQGFVINETEYALDCALLLQQGVCLDGEVNATAMEGWEAEIGAALTDDSTGRPAEELCCACGGGAACLDYKYQTIFTYNEDPTSKLGQICDFFVSDGACSGGTSNPEVLAQLTNGTDVEAWADDITGRTPEEACCACGGGMNISDNPKNTFVSWKLTVYGHSSDGGATVEVNGNHSNIFDQDVGTTETDMGQETGKPNETATTAPGTTAPQPGTAVPTNNTNTTEDPSGASSIMGGSMLVQVLTAFFVTLVYAC